jgi:hypothetical protein
MNYLYLYIFYYKQILSFKNIKKQLIKQIKMINYNYNLKKYNKIWKKKKKSHINNFKNIKNQSKINNQKHKHKPIEN